MPSPALRLDFLSCEMDNEPLLTGCRKPPEQVILSFRPALTTLRTSSVSQAEGWTTLRPRCFGVVSLGSEGLQIRLSRGTHEVSPGNLVARWDPGHPPISAGFLVEGVCGWPETTWSGLPNTRLNWRAGEGQRGRVAGAGFCSVLGCAGRGLHRESRSSGRGASQVPSPSSFPGAP